jgi:ferritin-like metal-binding protein YciE
MTQAQQKIGQYLGEAHAMEMGLVRDLQAQVAMTPKGGYRSAVQTHLRETRDHARRVQSRMREVGAGGGDPVGAAVGIAESVVSQALALGKAPLAMVRRASAEEKVLENAKEACASEAFEIATYTAIEHLARSLGDETTAELAATIRVDEERMLERVSRELPALCGAVLGIGVAGGGREGGREGDGGGREGNGGGRKGDGGEPWPGYDEQTVEEIRRALAGADERRAEEVRSYERSHKKRAGVLAATDKQAASG